MIYINNLSISNDRTQLNINVETNIGSNITSIVLWNQDTFKDYSQLIDISSFLQNINNKEIIIINNTDINITSFDGIWFLEITSNYEEVGCSTCQNSIIGITANLNNIKTYILDKILNLEICKKCNNNYDEIININLIKEGICTALSLGYYEEAIYLYKKLIKIIGSKIQCSTCKKLVDPKIITGMNFGIYDNNILMT